VFFSEEGKKRDDAGFDIVIGNPPYVEVGGEIENYLREEYTVTEYFVDLFHAFTEKATNITRISGEFGYILPEPWLTIENREKLRRHLLTKTSINEIVRIDQNVFEDATVDSVIIIATVGSSPNEIKVKRVSDSDSPEPKLQITIDQNNIINTDTARIEVEQTAETKQILDTIRSATVELGEIAELAIGVQAYNSSKHSQEQIENRVFHSTTKETDDYLPELAGNDVSRYDIDFDQESWLKYGDHLHDRREMKYLTGPRALVRQIPGSSRYKIHATYTEDTYCNYNTILNILSDSDYDIKYIVGILNSSLMSWVFPKTANSVVSDTFPKLSVIDLEKLPIRALDFDSKKEWKYDQKS
jgi:hypothetical protein